MIPDLNRRGFLVGAAGVAAAAGVVGGASTDAARASAVALPNPRDAGFDHVVVVTMENRSFDHYLGWLPGSDGRQAGLSYLDRNGAAHPTHHLTSFTGCGHSDPDHSYAGGRQEWDHNACDGWLRTGDNDDFCIGYYEAADLAFHGTAATAWTVCDRYFAAVMAGTVPNRLFQHAAQTDRTDTTATLSTMPTIWDRLAAAGLTGAYYYTDLPFTALWGRRYLGTSRLFTQFLLDAAWGALPNVAFVDPGFLAEDHGLSTDEHPLSDIRLGQHFLSRVYQAVTTSPQWDRTVLVITYDEWGGFFDHVPPPPGPDPRPDLGTALRGFRVPCLVISPLARRSHVAHTLYDHTSVLRMITWRFGLAPLTVRDATANNLAETLDFTTPPNPAAPPIVVPDPHSAGCTAPHLGPHAHAGPDFPALARMAARLGFVVPGAARAI